MKLNPDCVRDILLTVEELSAPGKLVAVPENSQPLMAQYSKDVIHYHILQCEAARLICGVKPFSKGRYIIRDLTPRGHEFLANIREQSIWNRTKETAASVGSFSLSALLQIASGIIQAGISSKLGY